VTALVKAGVTVPLVSARIVDEDMNDVPADGVSRGELVVRAPWLTPCYTGDAEASAALWRGGWLHTQDVASLDSKGTIVIRDRLKDVIKTGGEWVGSLDIEELVAGVAGIAEVAIVGVPDTHWGERPIAIIAPALGGGGPTLEALNAPIDAAIKAGRISRYAHIERIETIDTLPKTSVGKIDKKLLRAQFGATTPEPADALS
ncbi:MAG: o-succinylbenzoate--CoA ligase, partial [Sphingomonas bacterium]|nr:o-succinylbenzoate--CoA ligase [Sphingomonas bacterium]